MSDPVNHPSHYTGSGINCPDCGREIECIDITREMNFCRGNVIKYVWRAGKKGDAIEDLFKARQYLEFEIDRMKSEKESKWDFPTLLHPATTESSESKSFAGRFLSAVRSLLR